MLKQYYLKGTHFNKTRAIVAGTNKAGGLTRQGAGLIDVLTLTANIFAMATNTTNIHNKTGNKHF